MSEFQALKDEDLTDELFRRMKKAGTPKPPLVAERVWKDTREMTPEIGFLVNAAALGKPPHMIAASMDKSVTWVRMKLESHFVQTKILKKQSNMFDDSAKSMVRALFHKAYGVIEEILDSTDAKDSVKLEAAKYVIDHNIGKATQVVEHQGSILSDFMRKLDDEKDVTGSALAKIAATPEEPEYAGKDVDPVVAAEAAATAKKMLEKPNDDMDTLVDKIIQGEYVVGRRGVAGEE